MWPPSHTNTLSPELDAAAGWLTPTLPGSECLLWSPTRELGQDVGFRAQEKARRHGLGQSPRLVHVKSWFHPQNKTDMEVRQMLQQPEGGRQAGLNQEQYAKRGFSVSGHTWDCGGLDHDRHIH